MTSNTLKLEGDGAIAAPTLTAFLAEKAGDDAAAQALAQLLARLAEGAAPLATRLAQGRLMGDPTATVGVNNSGDKQKALDMAAHHHYLDVLAQAGVAKVLSEEAEEVITLAEGGLFDVAMDPIDGSGSIGIGAPLGALFCVFAAGESFLRSGREILAAAYVSFGHSVDFGFSTGAGTHIATYDPVSAQFYVDSPDVTIAPSTSSVAFNASNLRRWPLPLRRYVEALLAGVEGPRGRDFNMRWIAAAVGDLHRILRKGGTFMYPADARKGYEGGFLRLPYEAFPIAYLIEQAGGAATDGHGAILDLIPDDLHAKVPLYFGSADEIAVVTAALGPRPVPPT
ncbi:class 1 fructose-bisphosphatase [Arenibacterium sp. LLYu02]|uniref:class 1 fructose-bisphosphatase n=1 Tax=Arenibacterium sp. LLYu02 TaxID=3404132 RepID=UPI003B20E9AB